MIKQDINKAISLLTEQAAVNGFITYDDLMDVLDENSIPLTKTDYIAEQLSANGYKIFDHSPTQDEITGDHAASDNVTFADYAQTDYNEVFQKVIEIDPGLSSLVEYLKTVRAAQHGESTYLFKHINSIPSAATRIFEMNFRSVVRLALYSYVPGEAELADLIQQGALGLLHAIRKYDYSSDKAFGSYMNYWIIQYLSRGNPYRGNGCYFPVHMQELLRSLLPIIENHHCPECPPNYLECPKLIMACSQKAEVGYHDASKLLSYTVSSISIDNIIDEEEGYIDYSSIGEDISLDIDKQIDDKLCAESISELLNCLTDKERSIIKMRFGFDQRDCMTLEECGAVFGITKERVRQIETKALRKLSMPIRAKRIYDFYCN